MPPSLRMAYCFASWSLINGNLAVTRYELSPLKEGLVRPL